MTDSATNKGRDLTIAHDAADVNLAEAALDLHTGMDVLIDAMSTLCTAIINSESDTELMDDFNSMHWIALRLKNDVKDIIKRVDEVQDSARIVAA